MTEEPRIDMASQEDDPSQDELDPGPPASVGDSGDEGVHGKEKPEKKKKKKKPGSGRGVETMFRTAYRTHLDLSSLADTKANIMISINGIIISILLATIYPSLVQDRGLLFPSTVLLLTCLFSLVLAVLAARPRVTRKAMTKEDIKENRANILFFGNFINLDEESFLSGMWELMADRERTYTAMMRDLYGLGKVLERKYSLLRLSYTVFMVGLAVAVLAFLFVFASAGGGLARP